VYADLHHKAAIIFWGQLQPNKRTKYKLFTHRYGS